MANTIPSSTAVIASMVNHNHNHNHNHSHSHNHNHNHNHNHSNSSNVPSRGDKESLRSSNSAFTSTNSLLSVKGLAKSNTEDLLTSSYLKSNSISNSANSAFTQLPAQSSSNSVGSPGDPLAQGSNRKKQSTRDPLSHRMIEKRRRDRMNNCLTDLSRLIPNTFIKKSSSLQNRGRIEKTEIIEMAIKYLKHLQIIAEPLLAEDGPLGPSPTPTPVQRAEHDRMFQSTYSHSPRLAVMLMKDRLTYFRMGYSQCLVDLRNFTMEHPSYESIYTKVLEQTQVVYDNINVGTITKIMTTSKEFPTYDFDIVIKEKLVKESTSPTMAASRSNSVDTSSVETLTLTTSNCSIATDSSSKLSVVAVCPQPQSKPEETTENNSFMQNTTRDSAKAASIELTTNDQINLSSSYSTGHSSVSSSSSPDKNVMSNEATRFNDSEVQLSPGTLSSLFNVNQNENNTGHVYYKKRFKNLYKQGEMPTSENCMENSQLAAALNGKSEIRNPFYHNDQERIHWIDNLTNILEDAYDKVSPSQLMPAFVLHPSERFYVPLSIDSSIICFEEASEVEPNQAKNNEIQSLDLSSKSKRTHQEAIKFENCDESETVDVISVKKPRRESDEKSNDSQSSSSTFLSKLQENDNLYPIYLPCNVEKYKNITMKKLIGHILKSFKLKSENHKKEQKSNEKVFFQSGVNKSSVNTEETDLPINFSSQTRTSQEHKSQANSPVDLKQTINEPLNCTNNIPNCNLNVKTLDYNRAQLGLSKTSLIGPHQPVYYSNVYSHLIGSVNNLNHVVQSNNIHENGHDFLQNVLVSEQNGNIFLPLRFSSNRQEGIPEPNPASVFTLNENRVNATPVLPVTQYQISVNGFNSPNSSNDSLLLKKSPFSNLLMVPNNNLINGTTNGATNDQILSHMKSDVPKL